MYDRTRDYVDLDDLLHPAHAFGHPSEVLSDPDLSQKASHSGIVGV